MTCCKARFFRFYLQIIEYFWKIYKNCSFFQRKPKSLNFKVFQKFVKIKWSNPFLIVYFKFVKFKLNRSKSQRYGHFLKIHYRDSYGFLRLMRSTWSPFPLACRKISSLTFSQSSFVRKLHLRYRFMFYINYDLLLCIIMLRFCIFYKRV